MASRTVSIAGRIGVENKIYNGGGTSNALGVTTNSTPPTSAGIIDMGDADLLDVQIFCSNASQTPTIAVAEYSDKTPSKDVLTRTQEVAGGSDLTRTVDRAAYGLTTGTEGYAKAPQRLAVTPGSIVQISLVAAITGTAYVRYSRQKNLGTA